MFRQLRKFRRRRGVVLWACTALVSSGAFGAVTLPVSYRADTVVTIARDVRPVAPRRARVGPPPPPITVTTRTTITTTITTTAPRATDCSGVVAGVRWPPGWRVVCNGPRAGLLGSTDPSGVTTLFVRAGESTAWLRVVALHESGHAWDLARLDAAGISRWCAARGCDARRFFTAGVSADQPGGAEDWAAAWDTCHGGEYDRSYLGLPAPTAVQCALQNTLVTDPG